jgi:hypothetical protein
LNNNLSGQGKLTYADGCFYEGGWLNNKRRGQGKLTYADGCFYEGSWLDNKKHGQGTTSSEVLTGQFQDDLFVELIQGTGAIPMPR